MKIAHQTATPSGTEPDGRRSGADFPIDLEDQGQSIPKCSTASVDEKPVPPTFPEGGLQGWLVVIGAMMASGCCFGYLSAFG